MRTITLRTEEEFFKYLSDLSKNLEDQNHR